LSCDPLSPEVTSTEAFKLSERLQQVQIMSLNLVAIRLVTTGEVRCRFHIALHSPQHPVKNRFAETTTIRIAEGATMADRNVALPGGNTSGEILEVAFALTSGISFECH
jgi:hypothetical protein